MSIKAPDAAVTAADDALRLAARRSLVERLAKANMRPIVQPLMLSMSTAALAGT